MRFLEAVILKRGDAVFLKGRSRIKIIKKLFNVAQRTATRDLTDLVEKEILRSTDVKGAGSYYEIRIDPIEPKMSQKK